MQAKLFFEYQYKINKVSIKNFERFAVQFKRNPDDNKMRVTDMAKDVLDGKRLPNYLMP